MVTEILKLIEAIAHVFEARFMNPNRNDYPYLDTDPWQALAFFARHYAFERQGRSPNFAPAAADVIMEFGKEGISLDNQQVAQQVWCRFRERLSNSGLNERNSPLCPKGIVYTDKGGQHRTQQLSAVEFIQQRLDDHNLVIWAKHKLASDNVKEAHKALAGINGIGGKIVSLFLRDVALMFDVVPTRDRELLQSVDIWVRRTVAKLADKGSPSDDAACAHWIVSSSNSVGLSPERVNAGMWYLGAQIAGSQYVLNRLLADPLELRDRIERHVRALASAAEAWEPPI